MSRSLFSFLAAAVTVGGLITVVAAARMLRQLDPSRTRLLAGLLLSCYGTMLLFRPFSWPLINLAVLAGAVGGVLLLEGGLRTPGAVVTFLAVAAVVDILSVSGGLSRMLVERYRAGTSDLVLYLTLVVPIRARAIPIVGVGDLLVGGAAAAALIRLGLRSGAVVGTIVVGLLIALAYGLWRGGAPALPFIAASVSILVWRHTLRMSREPVARVAAMSGNDQSRGDVPR